MGQFSPWHLLIVALAFILLFGANKLPQMARSVGQSMRIFKAETRALTGEKEELPPTAGTSPAAEAAQPHLHQPHVQQPHLQEKPPAGHSG